MSSISAKQRTEPNSRRLCSRVWSLVCEINPIWFWSINLVAIVAAFSWLLIDARFEASIEWWQFENSVETDTRRILDMGDWWWLGLRNKFVVLLGVLVSGASMLMAIRLWFGQQDSRSLKSWLISISIVAMWVTLFTSWQDIAWFGKHQRLQSILSEFELVANDLKNDWPAADGDRPVIGPYMAYPVGNPRTLILLTLPILEKSPTTFGVIEGDDDVIRFELVGSEKGDWVEWHPNGTRPKNFFSGLGEPYTLKRFQSLTDDWYLVRY